VIDNWWLQGMMGGAKAAYDCIKAFSETDFTDDLKAIDVPGARDAWRGRPDRAVCGLGPLSVKLLKHGTLKSYDGFPHGMLSTHADVINPDLLAFVKG
jgi:non-heme chloroperoxidase